MNLERNKIREVLSALADGDIIPAVEFAESGIEKNPSDAVSIHILGLVAVRMDELLRAHQLFEIAHNTAPDMREHAEALAIILAKLGRIQDSLYFGKLSIALRTYDGVEGLMPAWLGTFEQAFASIHDMPFAARGDDFFAVGDMIGAEENYRRACDLNPSDTTLLRKLVIVRKLLGRNHEAFASSVEIQKGKDATRLDLALGASSMAHMGRFTDALETFEEILSADEADANEFSLYVDALSIDPMSSVESEVLAEKEWDRQFGGPENIRSEFGGYMRSTGSVRIGVVSSNFRWPSDHSGLWSLLTHHAQKGLKFFGYSGNAYDDVMTRRLRGGVSGWTDLCAIDDETAAAIIRNDGIDVLLDLDGHGFGSRNGIFRYRPAPVQLRLAGMPETVGGSAYDGVLGDRVLFEGLPGIDQPGVLSLEAGLFGVPGDIAITDEVAMRPILGTDAPVFGCPIMRHQVVDDWATLMDTLFTTLPEARVILHTDYAGGIPAVEEISEMIDGIEWADRIEFTPINTPYSAYVRMIDVLIEPLPFDAPSIALEALLSGIPVVGSMGDRPTRRKTASLLTGLGLDEWIIRRPEELASICAKSFADKESLKASFAQVVESVQRGSDLDSIRARGNAFVKVVVDFLNSKCPLEDRS